MTIFVEIRFKLCYNVLRITTKDETYKICKSLSDLYAQLDSTFFKKRENLPMWVYGVGVIVLSIMINISNTAFDYGILNAAAMIFSFLVVSFLYKGRAEAKAMFRNI